MKHRMIAAVATLALAQAPARADFFVETAATADNSYNIGGSATYTGKATGTGHAPYYSLQATPTYATASGTTDTTGLATYSTDRASSVSGPYPAVPGLMANALATADLATGTLHASASNNGISGYYTNTADADARAGFGDQLHFTVGGANATTTTRIGVRFEVHGSLMDNNPAAATLDMQASLLMNFTNGQATLGVESAADYNNSIPRVVQSTSGGFDVGSGFAASDPSDYVYNGTLTLTGADPTLALRMMLRAYTQEASIVDFGDTASLSFVLPSNVTFTSDSGVFLAASAVPEPGSLGLVLLGGGSAALAARRRRRRR